MQRSDLRLASSRFSHIGFQYLSSAPHTGFQYCAVDSMTTSSTSCSSSQAASDRSCSGCCQTSAAQTGTRHQLPRQTQPLPASFYEHRFPLGRKTYGRNPNRPENKGLGAGNRHIAAIGFIQFRGPQFCRTSFPPGRERRACCGYLTRGLSPLLQGKTTTPNLFPQSRTLRIRPLKQPRILQCNVDLAAPSRCDLTSK